MNINKGLICFLTRTICLLVVFALIGCGEKGPPVPPVETAGTLTAPHDLKLTHKKDTIFLNWSHETDEPAKNVKPDTFDVFMAKKVIGGCADCPFRFKRVKSAGVSEKNFFIRVEKGYRYYFRIQAVAGKDLKSPYSKTVQVEVK